MWVAAWLRHCDRNSDLLRVGNVTYCWDVAWVTGTSSFQRRSWKTRNLQRYKLLIEISWSVSIMLTMNESNCATVCFITNDDYLKQESCAIYCKDDRAMRAISGSNEPLRWYGHSKLSKMAACRQLGFDVTGNSAIRSADPENPALEPNMKSVSDHPLRKYGHSRILGHMKPHFGGEDREEFWGGVEGQRWHHQKERW